MEYKCEKFRDEQMKEIKKIVQIAIENEIPYFKGWRKFAESFVKC